MLQRMWQKLSGKYTSIGIEISDISIKLVSIVKRRGQLPHIQQVLIEALPEQTVDDGKIKDPVKIIQQLQFMLAKLNHKPNYVHLALPSQLIMVRFLRMPDVHENDLLRAVELEVKHNIHLPFSNPYFDAIKVNGTFDQGGIISGVRRFFQLLFPTNLAANVQPNGMSNELGKQVNNVALDSLGQPIELENMCDVMLVATSRDYIKSKMEVMESVDLKPTSIEIKALSILRYIELAKMISLANTILVIEVNVLTTDLNIYHDSKLELTRNVPIDFQETMPKDSEEEAMWAVVQAARGTQFVQHCNDLVYEVERLMSFYRYSLNHQHFEKFDHILICGEMSRIRDVAERIEKSLNVNVSLITPQEITGFESEQEKFPALTVALGLALRGNSL